MWSTDGWPAVTHKLYYTKQTTLHSPEVNLNMWSLYQCCVKSPSGCDDHSKFLIHSLCGKAAKSMTQTCPTLTKFSLENVCKLQQISSATQLSSSHQGIYLHDNVHRYQRSFFYDQVQSSCKWMGAKFPHDIHFMVDRLTKLLSLLQYAPIVHMYDWFKPVLLI